MPSIQDVADQINARLSQIVTNTDNTAQKTAENVEVSQDIRNELVHANTRLSYIGDTLANGVANLSQGLYALLQVQQSALYLLDHHRQQNDTMICELENHSGLLCNIKRKLGHQLQLSEKELESIERIEGITERVQSREAADYDNHQELVKKIEGCCPPLPTIEEECPLSCEAPIYREHRPDGQDWKPLPIPRPDHIG